MRRRIVMVVGVALVMALAMVASMSPALAAEVTLNKGAFISTEIKGIEPGAARGFWVSTYVRGIIVD